ncbi:MAG TPA: PRC-barrel domain-containing protein [Clostridia bacterium]|nr:PRC-barrel domain-containing protein [Clostridia bacterium]
MKLTSKIIAVCAATALVSNTGLAAAQQQSSPQSGSSSDPSQQKQQQQQQQPQQQSSSSQQNSSWQKAQTQEFFRASTLVGKNAQDSKGQTLGEIKEITFNQQGEIFALVDIGNGKWAAVPWQAVNTASAKGEQNLTINASQQQLKAGPNVTEDQWGSLNNPSFTQGIYTHYKVQSPTAQGGASSPSGMSQGQGSSDPQQQQEQQRQQEQQQQQQPQSQQQ